MPVLVDKRYGLWKSKILPELEVGYLIDQMKRHIDEEKEQLCHCKMEKEPKTFSISRKLQYFEQGKRTLQFLLADMGLPHFFPRIMDSYEFQLSKGKVEDVIVRLLYRC